LHRYALGWLGGVPVWILLWWVLGMLLVADFGARLFARLAPAAAGTDPRATRARLTRPIGAR
ncbi:MAG: hypothetical protein IT373_16750, partial [Polyangiaceae bacterium]|nr:hypothetical protein [Polyangiaceae bacterium]